MKITKRQLKRIIREEKRKLFENRGGFRSSGDSAQPYNHVVTVLNELIEELAAEFSDGELGNATLDAKMAGDTMAYDLLNLAAQKQRGPSRL